MHVQRTSAHLRMQVAVYPSIPQRSCMLASQLNPLAAGH